MCDMINICKQVTDVYYFCVLAKGKIVIVLRLMKTKTSTPVKHRK